MEQVKQKFIELVINRSNENSKAIRNLYNENLIGGCMSILRQELDSFVRIIYLGRVTNPEERSRLMEQTLNGERWKVLTHNNKWKTEKLFNKLTLDERNDVIKQLNQYHNFSVENQLTVDNVWHLIIDIFEKISSNITCYFDEIINEEMILM